MNSGDATTATTATTVPLTDPVEIAEYIRTHTGTNAPPLKDWHYCGCGVVTKVAPKVSNKKMARLKADREAAIEAVYAEAIRNNLPPNIVEEAIAKIPELPVKKEKPKTLDSPCDYKVKNRNAMRVHLRTIHSVYYCEYCRTRWNKPQKQKWKEHKQKYPSGQCRFPDTGGMGPGKSAGK